jgi:hypothetical protein
VATWKVITRDGQRGIALPDVDLEQMVTDPTSAYGSIIEDGVWVGVPTDRFVPFMKPATRIEKKALYTVKAVSPDGVLRQLPMEGQINNHVQSKDTGLGLQPYIRKGYVVFWDPTDGRTAFCPTWGCFAEPDKKFGNFCSQAHKDVTQPDVQRSTFSINPTTSSTY